MRFSQSLLFVIFSCRRFDLSQVTQCRLKLKSLWEPDKTLWLVQIKGAELMSKECAACLLRRLFKPWARPQLPPPHFSVFLSCCGPIHYNSLPRKWDGGGGHWHTLPPTTSCAGGSIRSALRDNCVTNDGECKLNSEQAVCRCALSDGFRNWTFVVFKINFSRFSGLELNRDCE